MQMITIKKVMLTDRHLNPGRTKHTLIDGAGARPFPPFTSLAITQYGDGPGYYLIHVCEDHTGTDTFHETLEDAIDQAEWEFEVRPEEWTDVREPFS